MKKLSKLMALLLALVLVLSTGFSAVAETTIDTKDQYFAQAKEALHEFIMGTKTWEEYWEVAKLIDDDDFDEFYTEYLSDEEREVMYSRMNGLFWDSCVSYTNVAPIFENEDVEEDTPSVASYSLRSSDIMVVDSTYTEINPNNALYLNKTAVPNADGTSYKVTLEAYVTGNISVSTTNEIKPCDIVLVLDCSSSMRKDFDGNSVNGTISATNPNRLWMLKDAINAFITQIKENPPTDTDKSHRLSIVTYNTGTDVPLDWTAASNVSTYTYNTVYGWSSQGTETQEGLATAKSQLEELDDTEGRQQVVVLFTDGVPTVDSNFNEKYAAQSIENARLIKAMSTKPIVYSVAIFSDANPVSGADRSTNTYQNGTTDATKIDAMCHAISSNYPSATASYSGSETSGNGNNKGFNGSFTVNYGTINAKVNTVNTTNNIVDEDEPSYYLTADSSGDLEKIFVGIANSIQTGSTPMQLGSTTVVKDIVTPYFDMPANATNVKVETVACTAYTASSKTAEWATTSTQLDSTKVVTMDSANDSISITGFDFAANMVTEKGYTEGNTSQSGTFHGRKLVISFDVTPTAGFLGGNNVFTNTNAGVYASDGTEVELYFKPDVDVQIKTVTPVINDDHIYLSNKADLERLISKYTADKTQYHQYTLTTTENGSTVTNTYTVDGINNAYVDIVYTFADASGKTIATYKIDAGQTTGDLEVATGVTLDLLMETDTSFNITCSLIPTSEGTYDTTTSAPQTGTVYVYKPVLTFKDTEEKYDTEMAEASETDYYNAAGNNVVSEVWKHGDTVAADQMTGEKPVLTLTYTATTKTGTTSFDWLNDSRVVYGKEDAYVNVTVWSDGDVDRDITGETTAVRNVCSLAHKDADKCAHASAQTTAAMGNDPEFIVHIYDVYGHLTITKVVEGTAIDGVADSFTFSVELKNKDDSALSGTFGGYTFRDGKASITLKNGESAEIKDLPPESKYTVTETVPVGYTKAESAVNNGTAGVIDAGKTDTLTFTNTYATGSLNVSKTVVGTDAPKSTDAFTFTVTLKGDDGALLSGTYGGVKFTNGVASFDLKDKETKTLTGLPINAAYTVTEAEDPDYTTTKSGETGEISTDARTAAFTNTYKYASLTIKKVAAAGTTIGSEETFIFDVKKGDSVISTVVVTGNNGTVTISGLTIGETYTVTEKTDWSWRYDATYTDSDATTADGTVKLADSGNTVTVTNKKTNNNWIDGEDSVVNTWNENSVLSNDETKN